MTKDAVEKIWVIGTNLTLHEGRLYSDPDKIDGDPGGDPGGSPEHIQIANWVSSPISLTRIYPLSDEELGDLSASGSANWYQSKWAAGIRWELPLGWMGGSFPYNLTLEEGPEGAEIRHHGREELVPPFYESLVWENPTVGTHEFTVSIEDQSGATDTVTFTLTVYAADNTTHFGWVNPGHASASDSNSGSRDEPWLTINGWYGGGLDTNTHGAKIIYYEDVGPNAGNGINIGSVSGVSYQGTSSQRCRLRAAKPRTHVAVSPIGVHGNGAYWQLESGAGWTWAGPFIHDDAISQDGPSPGDDRLQCFGRNLNSAIRYGFIGLGYTLTDVSGFVANGSNSSFYEFPGGDSTPADGFFFPKVILDGVTTSNERWAGIKNNNAYGVLCVGWEVRDCSNAIIFHQKGEDIVRTEERGCLAIEGISDTQFRTVQWINEPVSREYNTYCWNNINCATSPPPGGWGGGTHLQGGAGDNYDNQAGWRNNERIAHHFADADSGTLTLTRNARLHSGAYTAGVNDAGDNTVVDNDEFTTTSSSDFDSTTNLLTGAARSTWLGLVGCEMVEAES